MDRSLREEIALVLLKSMADRYQRLSEGDGSLNWDRIGDEAWEAAGTVEEAWLARRREEFP